MAIKEARWEDEPIHFSSKGIHLAGGKFIKKRLLSSGPTGVEIGPIGLDQDTIKHNKRLLASPDFFREARTKSEYYRPEPQPDFSKPVLSYPIRAVFVDTRTGRITSLADPLKDNPEREKAIVHLHLKPTEERGEAPITRIEPVAASKSITDYVPDFGKLTNPQLIQLARAVFEANRERAKATRK